MILNITSDDYNFHYKVILGNEFSLKRLDTYLMNKYSSKIKKKKIEEKFVYYDIDESRTLDDREVLYKKETNLKVLKHFRVTYLQNNVVENNFKIEDMISEITGAKKKLQINKIKSKISNKNIQNIDSGISFINHHTYPLLIDEIDMIENFVNNFRNVPVDENCLLILVQLGFDSNRSKLALILTQNNLNYAGDLLLNPNFEDIFNTLRDQRADSDNDTFSDPTNNSSDMDNINI